VWLAVDQVFARFPSKKLSSVGLLTSFFLINGFSSSPANIQKKKSKLCLRTYVPWAEQAKFWTGHGPSKQSVEHKE
jgi:hypothetical protein